MPAGTAARSHAAKHYYVAERFFGRAKSRRGALIEGIFSSCPWKHEGESATFCYECHTELLYNPVLLPREVSRFAELVRLRGFDEPEKTESRAPIAGRVALLQEVFALGIASALKRDAQRARRQALRELAPFLGASAAVFLLVRFSPWVQTYCGSESAALQGWAFFLAGLLGCALAPAHPFRTAFLAILGVLVGAAVGTVAHGIMSNLQGDGQQGDFSAYEVAARATMSAPSLLLSALIWKAGSASLYWDMGRLRELAHAAIEARRRKLLERLPAEIAAWRTKIAASGALDSRSATGQLVDVCSNALYGLAEGVLTQYDGVVAQLLLPSPFAVNELVRTVPEQLRPLFDECLVQLRREVNLEGVPSLTAQCTATLEARFQEICSDMALTLRASLAERYRALWREIESLFRDRLPKFVWGANR